MGLDEVCKPLVTSTKLVSQKAALPDSLHSRPPQGPYQFPECQPTWKWGLYEILGRLQQRTTDGEA